MAKTRSQKCFAARNHLLPLVFAISSVWMSCSRPPSRLYNVYRDKDAISDSSNQKPDSGNKTVTPAPAASEPASPVPASPVPGPETPTPATPTPVTPMPVTPMPVTPMPVTPMPATPTPQDPIPQSAQECSNNLSVGRIVEWLATTEGVMIPSSGRAVVKEGNQNVARVKFIGDGWHVFVAWLKNAYEAEVDLSTSKGFTITYSATADIYIQLRPSDTSDPPTTTWSGGDKYVVKLPSTNGQSQSLTFDFKDSSWTTLDALGKPAYPLSKAVAHARGFVFVGNAANDFAVTGLAIDGYSPPCP